MKAWELLNQPGAWTQHRYAENKEGVPVDAESNAAVKWCAVGAIQKCYPETHERAGKIVLVQRELPAGFEGQITVYNDCPGRKREEVVVLLKELDV